MVTLSKIETPLGSMVLLSDDQFLYFLQFQDYPTCERDIERMAKRVGKIIVSATTSVSTALEQELNAYFTGHLKTFTTPTFLSGTAFQNVAWHALSKIPCGQTRSYAQIAAAIHYPQAYRAVANANAANQIVILIPCHRVINADGKLGGYSAGIDRKKWLLEHEQSV